MKKMLQNGTLRKICFCVGCGMAVLTVGAWVLAAEVAIYFFLLAAILLIVSTAIPEDFFFRTYVLIEASAAVPAEWKKRVSESKKEDFSLYYLDEDAADIVNLPKKSWDVL